MVTCIYIYIYIYTQVHNGVKCTFVGHNKYTDEKLNIYSSSVSFKSKTFIMDYGLWYSSN